MQTISNIKEIKDGWYNGVLVKPLKGCENYNIQYILEIQGTYAVISLKPMTLEDINNINLDEWNFRPFREVKKANKEENI